MDELSLFLVERVRHNGNWSTYVVAKSYEEAISKFKKRWGKELEPDAVKLMAGPMDPPYLIS